MLPHHWQGVERIAERIVPLKRTVVRVQPDWGSCVPYSLRCRLSIAICSPSQAVRGYGAVWLQLVKRMMRQ